MGDVKNKKRKSKKYTQGKFTHLIENNNEYELGFKGRQRSTIKISSSDQRKLFNVNHNGTPKQELFAIDTIYIPEWKRERGELANHVKSHIKLYTTMENPSERQLKWYIRDFVCGVYCKRHKRLIKINMPADYIADTRSKTDGWDTYYYARNIITPTNNNNETDKMLGIFADKDVMYEHMIEEIMRDTLAVVLLVCNKIRLCNDARIPRTKKRKRKVGKAICNYNTKARTRLYRTTTYGS